MPTAQAIRGREIRKGLIRIPFVLITFLLICVAWVFFRAKTPDTAVYVVTRMFSRSRGASVMDESQWRLAFGAFLVALAEENYQALSRLANAPIAARTILFVNVLFGIGIFIASDRAIPFVYFQF